MSQILVLAGPSGSGKSTHAARLAEHIEGARILSSDALIERHAETEGLSYAQAYPLFVDKVKSELHDQMEAAFQAGVPVIWDRTSLSWDARAAILDRTPDSYERIAIAFEVPVDILRTRLAAREAETGKEIPETVLQAQIASYQRPHFDEGFDRIVVISEPGHRIRVV